MGSFSWLKADTMTNIANIAYGKPFKCLIPKEFDTDGIGFISDCYRDYGYLGEPTKEQMADASIPPHEKEGRYDMYELLAIWNSDYILPEDIEIYDFETKQHSTIAAGTRVGDILKGVDPNNAMKDISSDTEFNRQIGIGLGCHDKDMDKLPYPLKLVSANYRRSYEECVGKSYNDPNQGSPMTRNSLCKGGAFYSSKRYDGVEWKTLHAEWKEAEMSKNKTKEIEK